MDPLSLIIAFVGILVAVIFGYFQIVVPFVKGEVRLSRRWPFVEGIDDISNGIRPPGAAEIEEDIPGVGPVPADDAANDTERTRSFAVLTPGVKITHYEIIDKIGEGGMGEIYLARDTKLDRGVALKFLPNKFASERDFKARFKREARAAAALKHPNIVTIYEVGEHDGRPFIAMEYVEGESLVSVIKKGELELDRIVDLTVQICDGLNNAHQAGIIHRDIKPANIVIDTDGRPKLLDFGLAMVRGSERLTVAGAALGTIGYMSPEQVQGKEVDLRSDIFSLGVVIYEMISGHRPFRGDNEAAVIHALTHDDPAPLTRLVRSIPINVERILDKALCKDPSLRYQSVTELAEDIRDLRAPCGPPVRLVERSKMLAILPFENLGPPEEEYFSDGMTEEIISRLSAIHDLRVISRTSTMKYKGTQKTIREIGFELGIDYVLEGSVRWNSKGGSRNRVRITPQLVRVSDDTQLWSERYDRIIDDIFVVQSEIAEQVIQRMEITLLEPERQVLAAKPTDNLEAYHAYLRGIDYAGRPDYSEEDFRRAIEMFERAVELDPDFALAHADLGRAHSALYFHGHDRSAGRVSRAKAAIDRAIALRPDLAEVHLALGFYHYWCHQEFESALEEFAIAEKDLPNDTRILAVTAAVLKRKGRIEETVELYKKAFGLSPRDASLPHEIGCAYMTIRNYEEAERYYDCSISLAPNQLLAYVCQAWNFWLRKGDVQGARAALEAISRDARGPHSRRSEASLHEWYYQLMFERNYREAIDVLADAAAVFDEGQWWFVPKDLLAANASQLMDQPERARELYESAACLLEKELAERPDDDRVCSSLGVTYAGLDRQEEAIRVGKRAVELVPVTENAVVGPFRVEDLAFTYTLAGEYDEALNQIEHLLSIPSWLSIPLLRIDPRWDPLRNHPRFQEMLKKC
jgi:serine/threonine protein kinase/Flp pilus assembly protein TadD